MVGLLGDFDVAIIQNSLNYYHVYNYFHKHMPWIFPTHTQNPEVKYLVVSLSVKD